MNKSNLPPLPINDIMPQLLEVLSKGNAAVLAAPPGAGKTTRVPLALYGEDWTKGGKIIVLEPRRIAARAAAHHMADLLGEVVGETVGFRVRMESRVGPKTRIEVVTEGVFSSMALRDPELHGIAAVLFDEFHERSMDADFGLALAIDIQNSLRPDLRILPMSATLDGVGVAGLLNNAPVVESQGRSFPVEIRYEPKAPEERLADFMAKTIRKTLLSESGSILCFLPGQGEITQVVERMNKLPDDVDLFTLYGALEPREQDLAIRPPALGRRKIVLATSIAETSITIDGVRVVIDSGLARVPRFEASTGVTRLETVKASKASITQRAGRAGRTQSGMAIRLWHQGQNSSLPDFARPEILESELSSLVLDMAEWGVHDPEQLHWLDAPPAAALQEANLLLKQLDALDNDGRITSNGRKMQSMPVQPRLAHMMIEADRHGQAYEAATLSLLISERGVAGNDIDLATRLERLPRDHSLRANKLRQIAEKIVGQLKTAIDVETQAPAGKTGSSGPLSVGALLSYAWPDRIGKRTGEGQKGEIVFHLANGRRAFLEAHEPLAKAAFLVVAELQGSASAARILAASEINEEEINQLHGAKITSHRNVILDRVKNRFSASISKKLGAMELGLRQVALDREDDLDMLIRDAVFSEGLALLPMEGEPQEFCDRINFLHSHLPEQFPSMSAEILIQDIDEWLMPFLASLTRFNDLTSAILLEALKSRLGYERAAMVSSLAPKTFETNAGSKLRLRYFDGKVFLAVKVQELYGFKNHPMILEGKLPITLELLSPAMRPVQTTEDLAGFWQGSWRDVRIEMKGRYPRHFWPEDPANAAATSRAKPRGT